MIDYQTERKLEYLLQHLHLPESDHPANNPDQPRDSLGRFAETETAFHFDYDKIEFVKINSNTYIRTRKKKYLILDSLIVLGFVFLGFIVFASF